MVFSDYVKLRIVHYYLKGYTAYTVAKYLQTEDGIKVSVFSFKHYEETGSISRKPGSGRLSKVTSRVKELKKCSGMMRQQLPNFMQF